MRKVLFALVCMIFGAAGAFTVMTFIRSDRTPPVIMVSSQMFCAPDLSESELLEGVEARDKVDGDVSGSLMIESFTVDPQKETGIVVYAARDGSNNVAKYTRTLEAPVNFAEKTGLHTLTDTVTGAESETETESETEKETETETETETESETETEEVQETNPGAPKLILTQNSVHLKKGDTFNPIAYVNVIEDDYDNIYSLWRDIQVTGEYDMTEEGTYTLYYYVMDSSGNMSNCAKFKVVVE